MSHSTNPRSTHRFHSRNPSVTRTAPFPESTPSAVPQPSTQNGRLFPPYSIAHPQRPGTAMDLMRESNPIARFYFEDSPWTPENIRNPEGVKFPPSSIDISRYGPGSRSEIESVTAPRSDSGYQSHNAHSAMNIDTKQYNTHEMQEVTLQAGALTVTSTPTEYRRHRGSAESTTSHPTSHTSGKDFKCPKCHEVSKCRSDHK